MKQGGTLILFLVMLVAWPLRAQPVGSLQARIDAAAHGDTLRVAPGMHEGPLVISKPLALIGQQGAQIDGGGQGHIIKVHAPRVTVANLTIKNSGARLADDHAGVMVMAKRAVVRDNRLRSVLHGIYVKGADDTRITGNVIEGMTQLPSAQRGNGIHLWKSVGNVVTQNVITGTRDGAYFSFADSTRATDNRIRNVRFGLHYMYSDHNTFEDNDFFSNAAGAAIMYSSDLVVRGNAFHDNRGHRGYGLLLQSVEDAQFTDNRLVHNTTGLYLENSTRNVFYRNQVAENHRGIRLTGSSMDNVFTENTIEDNLQTAALAGTQDANEWHAKGVGNFWGRSGLVDLSGDDVSELPHHTVDLFAARREAFPYVALLTASPGVELLARAVEHLPPPGLPVITDAHPLVQAPAVASGNDQAGRWPGVAAGSILAILLLISGAAQARRVVA